MKKFNKVFYRISSLLLTLLMVLNVFAIIPLTANAAKKTEKSYEIAIVFDNSGSMYENQGKSCVVQNMRWKFLLPCSIMITEINCGFIRYANLASSQKMNVSFTYNISDGKCIMTIYFNKI